MSTVFSKSLCQIFPRGSARILRVAAGGKKGARLAEMGFVPGVSVRVIRHAPFGGGIEVELYGYRVCLRNSDAESILIN